MAVNYSWEFLTLECYPTSSGYNDVVSNIHWKLNAELNGYTAHIIGTQAVSFTTGSTFIPFNELTEDVVKGWVFNTMGETQVTNKQTKLGIDLQGYVTSVTSTTKLRSPWIID